MTIINQVTSFKISGFSYTGTDSQLNYTAGVVAGIAQPSKALVLDASSNIVSGVNSLKASSISTDNLIINNFEFDNAVLSNLSTLAGITLGVAAENKVLTVNNSRNVININNISANLLTGVINTSSQPNITSLGTLSSLVSNGNVNINQHNGTSTGLMLNSVLVTASANELNRLTGITTTTAELNRLSGITTSTVELNRLTGLIATSSELNRLSGVTASPVQINFLADVNAGTASASKALVLDSSRNITNINNLNSTGTIRLSTGRLFLDNTLFGFSHRNTTGGLSEIVTYSDGNNMNYIGSHTNNDFSLSVNQIQYLTVKNTTGRIGINTTTPNSQLEINSNSGNCLRLFNSGGNSLLDITINNQGIANLSLTGTLPSFLLSHSVNINDTSVSNNSSTGALIVAGGVGIGGTLNVNGSISTSGNIAGTLTTSNQSNITTIGTLTGLTSTGVVNITNNTASTLSTNGALIVSGGVGIGAGLNINQKIQTLLQNTIWNDSSMFGIGFLSSNTTHTDGITSSNSTRSIITTTHIRRIQLNASNSNVTTTLASSLYIENAPLAGTNMSITNSYALVINAGRTLISDTTTSNSSSTGALVISGGVGIGGALNVSGNILTSGSISGLLSTANQSNITSVGTLTGLTSSGIVNITNSTSSSSSTNGALVVSGGIGIGGALNMGNLFENVRVTTTSYTNFINCRNSTNGSNYSIQLNNSNALVGTTTSTGLLFMTENSTRATILSNGRFGINNTNPQYQLDVSGLISTNSGYLINGSYVIDSGRNLVNIGSCNATTINPWSSYQLNGTTVIDSSRNLVNISTCNASSINPSSSYQLNGVTVMDSSRYLYNLSGCSSSSFRISGTTVIDSSRNLTNISGISASSIYSSSNITTNSYVYASSYLQSGGDLYVGSVARVYGYLQIGTSNDTSRLISALNEYISTGDSAYITFGRSNNDGNQAEMAFTYNGYTANSNRFALGFHGRPDIIYMRWDRLVYRSDNASGFNTTSDLRLKKDIISANLTNCYNNIKNLRLVTYKWKDDKTQLNTAGGLHKNLLGWIAQEVETIIPDAVTISEDNGLTDCRSLKSDIIYQNLFGCVQQLIKKIENLENENQLLKEQIKTINDKLNM